MASRRPLVTISGVLSELPIGDTVVGASPTLTASPSGLILVGGDLGIDGAAQTTANSALASGNAALFLIANTPPGITEAEAIGLIIGLS